MAAKRTATVRPFADTKPESSDTSEKARRRIERIASLSRLVANRDFGDWLFGQLVQLCAFGDNLAQLDDFHQGIRSAGAYIRRTLVLADGGAQLLADLDRRYWDGVRRGIFEAEKTTSKHEEFMR